MSKLAITGITGKNGKYLFQEILSNEIIIEAMFNDGIKICVRELNKKLVPMQPGDVAVTYADTSALERDFGFKPSTSLREGLHRFAQWYKEFYMQ